MSRTTGYSYLAASTALACALLTTGGAFAQSRTAAEGGDGPALEEIVVTGERNNRYGTDVVQAGAFRGAKTLDTPLTVSVLPRALIDTQQAKSLQDILANTAGVGANQTSPTVYSGLTIRGINVDNRNNYRLNGILPVVNLIDLPLEDKDRVEVLKGASALYYGFTSPSGIVNMTMKRPTPDLYLQADVFGNGFGGRGGHIDFGDTVGPIGARINAVYETTDSGIDYTSGPRSLISGAFDFKPLHNLTFSVDAEHIFKKVNEPGVFRFSTLTASTPANPYPAVKIPPLLDPHTNFGPSWALNRAQETNLLGNIDWKISRAWDLNLSGGTSRLSRDRHFNTVDPNAVNTNPANGPVGEDTQAISYQPNARYLNRNARLQLAGTFDTGPFTHEVLIGASINVRAQYASTSAAETCIYTATGAVAGGFYTYTDSTGAKVSPAIPTGDHTAACLQNYLNPHATPQLGEPYPTYTATQINDKGAYIFDRIKFHDWLQLLGGLRKSDYTESVIGGADTFKVKPLNYSFGAVVKPAKWASLYGTYIQGIETTTAAPATVVNAGQQLPATKSNQTEAGVKIEPRSGMLFQIAWYKIVRGNAVVNGANYYVLSGRARYQGVEASFAGDITSTLSLYASGQILHARVIDGPDSANIVQANGSVVFSPTLVGRLVDNTPVRTASVSLNYKLDRFVHGLSINGGFNSTSTRAVDPLNRAFVPGYVLLNLGGAYELPIAGHDVIFRVNANNITGKRYWVATDADFLAEGAPAVVRFSASVKF
jgi:iron complex outermembrane receptor protein